MNQKFYLIGHNICGDNPEVEVDKVFLQRHDAVKWGRNLATKNASYIVKLYEQDILRNGVFRFVRILDPFKKEDEQPSLSQNT